MNQYVFVYIEVKYSKNSLLSSLIKLQYKTNLFIYYKETTKFDVNYGIWAHVRHGSHRGGSLQDELRDKRTCGMTLASAYVLCCLSATWSQLQMIGKKSEMRVSADWCVTVEHWRSSSIRVIFINYQTSKLQCNY